MSKPTDKNIWDAREAHLLDDFGGLMYYLGTLVWEGRGRNREGWLTPDGIFLGCEHYGHDAYAEQVLGYKQSTLALSGWIKITCYGTPNLFDHQTPTEAQAEWLLKRMEANK